MFYFAAFDLNRNCWCVCTQTIGEATCLFYSRADSEAAANDFVKAVNVLCGGSRG
jgi:hypothetical protein